MNEVVELSRLQFGATAMFHFLFVPLKANYSFGRRTEEGSKQRFEDFKNGT